MRVTIMYRNNYDGGDGWTYYPMTIDIGDNCPQCGCPRGKPRIHTQCEDGEYFHVHVWTNECGHVDFYQSVYEEHKARLKKRVLQSI